MSAAAVAMGVGAGMQLYGQYQANKAEAKAEEQNALFYQEQAKIALEAAKREQLIFEDESEQFLGTQINAFVKGGVDLSGSALMKIAATQQQIAAESETILATGKRNERLSLLKADQANKNAKRLSSTSYNLLQAAPAALNFAGGAMNSSNRSSSPRGNTPDGGYSGAGTP